MDLNCSPRTLICCMCDLVPPPGMEPLQGAQSLNHWTTREVSPSPYSFHSPNVLLPDTHMAPRQPHSSLPPPADFAPCHFSEVFSDSPISSYEPSASPSFPGPPCWTSLWGGLRRSMSKRCSFHCYSTVIN